MDNLGANVIGHVKGFRYPIALIAHDTWVTLLQFWPNELQLIGLWVAHNIMNNQEWQHMKNGMNLFFRITNQYSAQEAQPRHYQEDNKKEE